MTYEQQKVAIAEDAMSSFGGISEWHMANREEGLFVPQNDYENLWQTFPITFSGSPNNMIYGRLDIPFIWPTVINVSTPSTSALYISGGYLGMDKTEVQSGHRSALRRCYLTATPEASLM